MVNVPEIPTDAPEELTDEEQKQAKKIIEDIQNEFSNQ